MQVHFSTGLITRCLGLLGCAIAVLGLANSAHAQGTYPTTTTLASSVNPATQGATITFTATVSPTTFIVSPTGTVTFLDNGVAIGTGSLSAASANSSKASFSTASLTVGTHSITASYGGGGPSIDGFSARASTSSALSQVIQAPPPSPTPPPNTDSPNLTIVESAGTELVANTSGGAISGAVANGIQDGFSDDGTDTGNQIAANGNGAFVAFAPEESRDTRVDNAFSALAYDKVITRKPARVARDWSLWADVAGAGWDRDATLRALHGTQLNTTWGIGRKLSREILVGVFGGYENFGYDFSGINGRLTGNGWTAGAYASWRVGGGLHLDGMAAYSNLGYAATAGIANGTFSGSRWLTSAQLSGNYYLGAFVVEPSASVFTVWEGDSAWTDSLGVMQAARNFYTGRASAGGKVYYPVPLSSGTMLMPYVGFYGDYRFSSTDVLPVGLPVLNFANGGSARVTTGTNISLSKTTSFSLGGEYGGIGSNDYNLWTANARGTVRF